jgi:hypothetical protein
VTLLSLSVGTTILNKTTTETLTATGGLSTFATLNGNVDVILTGGTWNGVASVGCNSLTIAGNVTIINAYIGTTTLTYSSGTVTHSGTLNCFGNPTINTAGITWNNISITSGGTCTITSLLTASGTLNVLQSVSTFAGTAGFTCGTLTTTNLTTANTITLQAGITYTVTSALTSNTSRVGSIQTFASSSPTIKAILTLNPGATCNVLSNFTRIDSSAGRIIRSFNGTITDCLNIVVFNDLPVSGF